MNLLLDTCTMLWFLSLDPKLSAAARAALEDPANVRWVSPMSLMEVAIKVRIGKLPLKRSYAAMFPMELTSNDIHLLPIEPEHIEPLTRLPLHHKDPFDRLLAATAMVEALTVVSADPAFDAYGLTRLW